MMFEIRQMIKQYGRRTVLDIEALVLEKRAVYALLGPNGSGKTTLLEILALLQRPDAGEILFDGRRIDYFARDLFILRRQIGLVQQNPVLFTTSVSKNIAFGLKIRGIDGKEREKRVDEALSLVDMRQFKDVPAQVLSGGETQRIAMAMVLACMPRVLLLDEPFASVDVENQVAIERIVHQIHSEKGIFIIFTSHNVEQAFRISPRVLSLSHGRPVTGRVHNLFYGDVLEEETGRKRCRIQGILELFVDSDRTGRVRLSIDPAQIQLFPDAPADMENVVPARVVQIGDEADRIRITGDAGVLLTLWMAKEAFRASGLTVGAHVFIRIPGGAVRFF